MLLAASASDLLAARQQMAFTLATHIVIASLGISFPAITLIANWRAIRRDDADALRLAQRWSKAMALLFAVGAVTGTVLSFEMGLLWPGLFETYGPVMGAPFAVEGLFFFTEAIFIAIYIYGWKRLPPWPHFWSGVPIVVAGILGGLSVVAANAWMNQPAGFTVQPDGSLANVDPIAGMFNDAMPYEVVHMLLAAYIVGGFLIASVYAVALLRGRTDRYHRLGFLIPFTVGCLAIGPQLLVGDWAARAVYEDQPIKFAAIELKQSTSANAPEHLGGILVDGEVVGALSIPDLASVLAGFSPDTVIQGLDTVPPEDRPPANIVHLAFDAMVLAGSVLAVLALWFGITWWRRRDLPRTRWFLRLAAASGGLAILALEAGWVVTEVGRQPWIVYGHLRTRDAVTGTTGLWWLFGATVIVYTAIGVTTVLVLRGMSRRWRAADAAAAADTGAGSGGGVDIDDVGPYSPRPALATRLDRDGGSDRAARPADLAGPDGPDRPDDPAGGATA